MEISANFIRLISSQVLKTQYDIANIYQNWLIFEAMEVRMVGFILSGMEMKYIIFIITLNTSSLISHSLLRKSVG